MINFKKKRNLIIIFVILLYTSCRHSRLESDIKNRIKSVLSQIQKEEGSFIIPSFLKEEYNIKEDIL